MPSATLQRPTSAKKRAPRRPSDPATRYAVAVVDGKIVAGPLVRLACQRHLRDLVEGKKRGLRWDPAKVKWTVGYFRDVLRLNAGEHEGKPFILSPFQCFIVGSLFGWKKADGTRRYQSAYIEIGKGSGKSPLGAGIALLMLTADGEARAEVYSAAGKKDQAMIAFQHAVAMVDQSPELSSRLLRSGENPVWNLAYTATGSFFRPVSSDKTQSGPLPHCAILDEIHEHKDDTVVKLMRAGTKGRRQPLIIEITNSGWDRRSICWQHHEYSRQVLEGSLQDDEWFAYVCGLDKEDDWRDEKVWIKANPNLGVSIRKDYLRKQVREAEGMPAQQGTVRRLNFCEWTEQAERWIETEVWDRNAGVVPESELAGLICYAGLDLSSTTDLAALELIFPLERNIFAGLSYFWVPANNVKRRVERDKVPYDLWIREGLIKATEGDVIDYDVIRTDINALGNRFHIKELAIDRWNATQITTQLIGDGFTVVPFGQGFASMSAPTKEFEKILKAGQFRHGANPVLKWMAGNVAIVQDAAGNMKPAKDKSSEKIDGIVATIMGYARAIVQPEGSSGWLLTSFSPGG